MIRPMNASLGYVFYYSEEILEENKMLSGWSLSITYESKHYKATYCKYFSESNKNERIVSRLRFHAGVEILNYFARRLQEVWKLPEVINEAEVNTGIKYCFCMNGYQTIAYNIFRIDELDSFQRMYLLEKNPDMFAMGAANFLIDCFDDVANILYEYDNVIMTHAGVRFEERSEVLDAGLDDVHLTFDVPYKYVYMGHYIDAYAVDLESKPYICSCNRKAIENKIRLYERYFQYDTQVKDRNLLLLENLGLPEPYEIIIKESGEPWSLDWLKYLEFKDGLCPVCNKAIVREPHLYTKYPSKFEQRYKKEYERRYNSLAVSNNNSGFYGYYCIEECVPDEIKDIILPEETVLVCEICKETGYSEEKVKAEFEKLHGLPEGYADIVKGDHVINKAKKQSYEIEKEYGLDSDFVEALQKTMKKRYQTIKKMVREETIRDAKAAEENMETGGGGIEVEINMFGIHYTFTLDKNSRKIEAVNHSRKREKESKTVDAYMICNLLNRLDFKHLKEEADQQKPKNYLWKVKGTANNVCYIGSIPSRRVIRFWNYIATTVFELEAKK